MRHLVGSPSHPAWPGLAAVCDAAGSWAEPPAPAGAGTRTVVLVGYEALHDAPARLARLSAGRADGDLLLVAPDFPDSSSWARPLLGARAGLPRANLLRHAPPLEAVIAARDDIQLSRTLALSLPERPVPLVAWADVEAAAASWWRGELAGDQRVEGPDALTGTALAAAVREVLAEVLELRLFARRRLAELDANRDGVITVEEAEAFLASLGHPRATAADIARSADLDGDGTISPYEFTAGVEAMVARALHDLRPPDIAWLPALPQLLAARWMDGGLPWAQAAGLAEHLATTTAGTGPALRGAVGAAEALRPHALAFVNLFVLPGRGIMTVRRAPFGEPAPAAPALLWSGDDPQLGEPAILGHVEMPDGRRLDSRQAGDGAVEIRWRSDDPGTREVLRFGPGAGARAVELAGDRVIGLAARGRWPGLHGAISDLMERRPLRNWERALFRELGELRVEHVDESLDPEEVVCHCAQITRATLVGACAGGATTRRAIAERTRATTVCGGCIPLVDEILGSPRLKLAEVRALERLGDHVRVTLTPAEGAPAPSRPGQHVVLQARIQDRWTTRAYSLTSPGGAALPYEITVKRFETGAFSRWLADHAALDSLFRCSEPTGDCFLAPDEPGPIYVFAGGIGITPGIAMARTVAADGSRRRIHLDWSARHAGDFVFAAELDRLAAEHPNITWTRRRTASQGRLDAATVAERYRFDDRALAFVCGPGGFLDDVRGHLRAAGWPDERLRVEVFSSKVDDEGHVEPPAPMVVAAAGAARAPVPHESFFLDLRPERPVAVEAEAFLAQMYGERGLGGVLEARLAEVRAEIERTGSYTHTRDELAYGVRLAWRNATRCVGRFFWQHLVVRDMRHLETEEQIFAALVDHVRLATNGGDLVSTITIFRPGEPRVRLYNSQLVRYAGYRRADGTCLGDPISAEVTEKAQALGWRGAGTRFDVLPIIVRIGDRTPRWFELPREVVMEVPLEHPEHPWFADLGLKWYALPAVSDLALDLGGVHYRCAPFNGFYMVTEIGARNLADIGRYDLLPALASRLGLDTSSPATLWRDRAVVELNVAVLHSFRKRGVRMLDHHSAAAYFLEFEKQERAAGRPVYGDWSWLVPPLSGSTSPLFFRADLENVVCKPMFAYQAPAWGADGPPPAHEGPIPPCPRRALR